jgi:integrase
MARCPQRVHSSRCPPSTAVRQRTIASSTLTCFHLIHVQLRSNEVADLVRAAGQAFMTLYATGVRRAELTHLKVTDVDSRRMVIHVHGGKGRKDRDLMLSPKLLDEFRKHWRRLKRKPSVWLFPGNRHHTSDKPISTKVIWHACRNATKRAGIKKQVHPHTIRHCFATHLLERGYRSTQHPDAVRPQRSGTDHHLPPHFRTSPERDSESAGLTVTEK